MAAIHYEQGADRPAPRIALGIRQGRGGPLVCATCGCRLEPRVEDARPNENPRPSYWHFQGIRSGRDARGCLVGCVDMVHLALG